MPDYKSNFQCYFNEERIKIIVCFYFIHWHNMEMQDGWLLNYLPGKNTDINRGNSYEIKNKNGENKSLILRRSLEYDFREREREEVILI